MSKQARVDVFAAGRPVRTEAVDPIKAPLENKCDITVYDFNKGCERNECRERAKACGVKSVPAVAIAGWLASCSTGRGIAVTKINTVAIITLLTLLSGTTAFPKEGGRLVGADSVSRPVEAKLRNMAEESAKKLPPEFQEVGRQGIEELNKSGMLKKALNVGGLVPAFNLPDAHGKAVSSGDLLAKGPMVIVFYRGAWCPYCNLYLRSIQEYLPQFRSLGATLVAISGESPDNSLSVEEKDSLQFPVLSDTNLVVARKFGIVYEVPAGVNKAMQGFGLDLKEYYHSERAELPLSATYVVDRNGKVVYAFLDPDYKHRAEPDEIIAALKAIQQKR